MDNDDALALTLIVILALTIVGIAAGMAIGLSL